MAIDACRKAGKYIGICGQGPSDHPDLARWLVEQGIESMSLNPDTVVETWLFLAGGTRSQVVPRSTGRQLAALVQISSRLFAGIECSAVNVSPCSRASAFSAWSSRMPISGSRCPQRSRRTPDSIRW